MIAEAIKNALGDDLAPQVEAALKGKGKEGKDLELVIGNDGSFVPAHKYDEAKSRAESAEAALKTAAAELKAIGGSGDAAKLAEDVKNAQQKLSGLEESHAKEITALKKTAAIKAGLAGQVHDPADILALLNMDEIELAEDGSLKTDLNGLLQPLKETKGYLFKEENPSAGITGAKPASTGKKEPAAPLDGPVIL